MGGIESCELSSQHQPDSFPAEFQPKNDRLNSRREVG